MSVLTHLWTASSYLEIASVEELKITHQPNAHGTLYLTAVIDEEVRTNYLMNAEAFETVEIVKQEEGDEDPVILFKGIIKYIDVLQVKDVYLLLVKGLTGSFISDVEIKYKSYQVKERTFSEIIQSRMVRYPDGDSMTQPSYTGVTAEQFILQYGETDWEFCIRMASHMNLPVIPSLIAGTPKLNIGIPTGDFLGDIEKYNYDMSKDLEWLLKINANEKDTVSELDAITFFMKCSENFTIGDMLTYCDRKQDSTITNLYINRKEIADEDGVLVFKYWITTANGFVQPKRYNEKIIGLSLAGTVMDRVNDTLSVALEIDMEDSVDNTSGQHYFKYTTPYTAEGSAGWYIMPEIDDTVFIYFPDRDEKNGVGRNSIRTTGGGQIGNPDIKYLCTKSGRKIKLAPDEITISHSNWSDPETGEKSEIYINLNGGSGIQIRSTKAININGDGDVNITADKNLIVQAKEGINLKCKSSEIKVASNVEVNAPSVLVN